MSRTRKSWARLRRSSRPGQGGRFRSSLLFRYLVIIVVAMMLLPIMLPATLIVSSVLSAWVTDMKPANSHYLSSSRTEDSWHREAVALKGATPEQISTHLKKYREIRFPIHRYFGWMQRGKQGWSCRHNQTFQSIGTRCKLLHS
nr:hypothetical protein [Paenibacillus sp. IHB B 3084]